jgi:hypothetical protein
MQEINLTIARMVQALGVKNMTHMLDSIGVSNGLGSAWKKRGKVPDGPLAKVSELSGVSIHWLKTGDGEMRQVVESIDVSRGYQKRYTPTLSLNIASQAMDALDAFLERKKMNPSPKMKRKLYEGLVEEYLDREEQVEMEVILNELAGGF